uniref:Uncharacterized protein n=1 Tax=Candidatus Desulfatibia profunda TaxID=2841695 RepID=A0A8J6NLA5_9BACT|nr:hypothetical protein [Candidatus Desulfatibia profunda]
MDIYKLNQAKIEITGVFDKNEVSVYHLGSILQHLGKLFEAMPMSILKAIDEDSKSMLESTATTILSSQRTLIESVIKLNKQLEHFGEDLWIKYGQALEKHKAVASKLKELPDLKFKTSVYELERLVEVAEKLSLLSDDQWRRLVKFFGEITE